jgi:hypothetical protein
VECGFEENAGTLGAIHMPGGSLARLFAGSCQMSIRRYFFFRIDYWSAAVSKQDSMCSGRAKPATSRPMV